MNRFADALRSALAQMDWNQSDLVDRSGAVTQGTLSRYLAGLDTPKPSTLDQICRHFPDRIREEIAAAYLVEQIPPSASKLVTVTCAGDANQAPKSYELDKPAPGSLLERNIEVLTRRALTDPNLALVLDYLASSIDGRAPISDQEGDPVVWTVKEQEAAEAARKALEEQERESGANPPPKPKKKAKYS